MCIKSIIISTLIGMPLYAFDIMIDIGHTPTKFGAMSATCEKEFNYNNALGHYLLTHLMDDPKIKISMLSEREVSFQQRYESSSKKDLFFSIHHDSVQERYIEKNQIGCPSSNHAAGFSIFISRKNIYFSKSLAYAKKFGEALVQQGLKPSLHHAQKIPGENRELLDSRLGIYVFDDLKVLKNAKSPAILFEVGVIVNPVEEMVLKSDEHKNKILSAISSFVEE